jgi:hypothetical protein
VTDDDKLPCLLCREQTTCSRARPNAPEAVYLMCDKCWGSYTRAHKMCRHCGEKQ